MTRRRATVGAIAAAVLLVTTSGCGSGSDDSGAGPVADTTTPTTAGDAQAPDDSSGITAPTALEEADDEPAPTEPVVPEALQFTAPLVGGGTFDGAAVTGKPTVFWFWAPT